MHILLVRFSSMGDVVLQTATVNWLRSLFGNELTLTFVTSQEFVSLVQGHPGINHVVGFDRRKGEKWKDLLAKLDALDELKPFDLILDLHATLRSFRLKLSYWTIPALTVDKRRWERFLLTRLQRVTKPLMRRLEKTLGLEPQVERIINDFDTIFGGTKGIRAVAEYRQGPHDELTSLSELPAYPIASSYIVLAPSASFEPKRWPVQSFVQLARELLEKSSLTLVILAGPDDKFCSVFDEIGSPRVLNLQGKTSLKESMSVLAGAKLCIGNDSGMNHIAEAYGVPCVTIFGPTDPLFGFAPHGEASTYLSKDLHCKPCSTTGKKPCSQERLFCMEGISVDEVLAASLERLEGR